MRYIIVLLPLIAFSCQSTEEHGHDHDQEAGHAHGNNERPAVDYTAWTDKTELFVEFPALTVGATSRFAAHFTVLDKHQPVRQGSVTVSLIKDGKGIRQTAGAPSSPGIFTPSLQPKEAGIYQLVFELNTPAYADKITLNNIEVFATAEDAEKVFGDEEEGNAISFLKEQAWKMEFQTDPVVEKEIYQVIPTSGVWRAAAADHRTLTSPAKGIVNFSSRQLTIGSEVKKGQPLMFVSSAGLTTDNLETDLKKAKANLDQAKAAYDRKFELYQDKIIAKAEFEQATQKYEIAKAEYETLRNGYSSGGKQIIAPMNGYIKSITTSNGGFVNQGEALITLLSHNNSLLEVYVSPSNNLEKDDIQDLWYKTGSNTWSSLRATAGKVLSVDREVEADQPMLSIFVEINEGIEFPEGSFTEAQLAVGKSTKQPTVPASALLEDYGSYSVMVQLNGESFERRNVTIGRQNGNEVEILNGLTAGEVVVTKGAYQVKMASMSGQAPAHGHAH